MMPHNDPVGPEGVSGELSGEQRFINSLLDRLYPQIKQGRVRHHNKYTVKYHKRKKKQPKRYHINK